MTIEPMDWETAQRRFASAGEPQATMMDCPDCGVAIRVNREHECDPWKWLNHKYTSLRSRCEELERENKRLLELCDSHLMTMANIRLEEMSVRQQRDEARQWANRRTATANEHIKGNTQLRQDIGEIGSWYMIAMRKIRELEAELAEAEKGAGNQPRCHRRIAVCH